MYTYICVCVSIYIYIYVHIHTHTHVHTHKSIYIHIHISVFVYRCIYIFTRAHIRTYMCVNLYMYIYIYTQYYSEYLSHTKWRRERGQKVLFSITLVYGHITDGFLVRTHNPQCTSDAWSKHNSFLYTHTCVWSGTDAMPCVCLDWKALYLTMHTQSAVSDDAHTPASHLVVTIIRCLDTHTLHTHSYRMPFTLETQHLRLNATYHPSERRLRCTSQ